METLETVVQPETKTDDSIARPRAFIILGLEGAGTYMIQNALVEAGCGRNDRLDQEPPEHEALIQFDGDIVIRKSFPHAGRWPQWRGLIRKCQGADYDVHVIWIIREPNAQKNQYTDETHQEYQICETIALVFLWIWVQCVILA